MSPNRERKGRPGAKEKFTGDAASLKSILMNYSVKCARLWVSLKIMFRKGTLICHDRQDRNRCCPRLPVVVCDRGDHGVTFFEIF